MGVARTSYLLGVPQEQEFPTWEASFFVAPAAEGGDVGHGGVVSSGAIHVVTHGCRGGGPVWVSSLVTGLPTTAGKERQEE